MKKIFFGILLLFLVSCSKESFSDSIIGKWTIIETNAGTGYGFIKTSYQPLTEININFQPNGLITLSGPKPGIANSDLWNFNRYEILSENAIKFYHTNTTDTMRAHFILEGHLSLWYDWARCGHEEKFIRR